MENDILNVLYDYCDWREERIQALKNDLLELINNHGSTD